MVLFSGKEFKTFYSKNKIVHYTCYSAKNLTYNSQYAFFDSSQYCKYIRKKRPWEVSFSGLSFLVSSSNFNHLLLQVFSLQNGSWLCISWQNKKTNKQYEDRQLQKPRKIYDKFVHLKSFTRMFSRNLNISASETYSFSWCIWKINKLVFMDPGKDQILSICIKLVPWNLY